RSARRPRTPTPRTSRAPRRSAASCASLPEDPVEVAAVDLGVARDAVRELRLRHVVRRLRVALETERLDARIRQHPAVRRAVRIVAGGAALGPLDAVIEQERSALLLMAREARAVLHVLVADPVGVAVRVVPVAARDASLGDAVAVGQTE